MKSSLLHSASGYGWSIENGVEYQSKCAVKKGLQAFRAQLKDAFVRHPPLHSNLYAKNGHSGVQRTKTNINSHAPRRDTKNPFREIAMAKRGRVTQNGIASL